MYLIPHAPLWHLLLESAGIVLAVRYYYRLRATTADPVGEGQRLALFVAAAAGALVGSRLLGGLENPEWFLSGGGPAGWIYYLRAKTIVGGLLGGLWAVETAKRWLGIRQRTGDIYVFPLLLAMIVGRFGCLAMGVGEPTYGVATDSVLGLDLGDGVPRHATTLYEIVFLGLLWLFLSGLQRRRRLPPGGLFALFMVTYLSYRFLIGFLQPLVPVGGLGAIQWACLLGLAWYLYDHGLFPPSPAPARPTRAPAQINQAAPSSRP